MKPSFIVQVVLCLIACSSSVPSGAVSIEKQTDESTDIFVRRIAPQDAKVIHKPIETFAWRFSAPAIIAFYEEQVATNDYTGSTKIDAVAFIPVSSTNYEKLMIDSYEPEGGNPRVETVFFASIDKTEDKKLFIVVSWDQNHATVKGRLYATFVYAKPSISLPEKLSYLPLISEKLSGGCDCWRADGPSSKARFKTAAEIKAALPQLKH